MSAFGLPLCEAAKFASTRALFNGHELHLPLVASKSSITLVSNQWFNRSLKLNTVRLLSTGLVPDIAQLLAGRDYRHIQLTQSQSAS